MEKKKLVKLINNLKDLLSYEEDLDKVWCLCFVLFADYLEIEKLSFQNRLIDVDTQDDKLCMLIEEQLKDFPVLFPIAKESRETIQSIASTLAYVFSASRIYFEKGFHTDKDGKILEASDNFYIKKI